MAKKLGHGGLRLVSGGPGSRPMVWRVTDKGLSRSYTFTPGVVTFVEPEDRAWFKDSDHLGGRVFEVVAPETPPALPVNRGAGETTGNAAGGASGKNAGGAAGPDATGKD